MKCLLVAVTAALTFTSCTFWDYPHTLIPEDSTPYLANGPLGVHREDSISFDDGKWEVIDWEGKRIHLVKGDLRKSLDVRKAKPARDFEWLYESPEGRFSVGCPHR